MKQTFRRERATKRRCTYSGQCAARNPGKPRRNIREHLGNTLRKLMLRFADAIFLQSPA